MSVKEISASELASYTSRAGCRVIDVREIDEYLSGHVPSAINISLSTVPDNVAQFRSTDAVYVICRSGGRSMQACEFLHDSGVTNAVNVAGGTVGWISIGNRVVTGDQPG